jgi:hydrogenase maturation protease
MKTLVLGLGNSILCDDSVGLRVVQNLKNRILNPDISIVEASEGGLGLIMLLSGYDKAIIVDAIQTKNGQVGDIYRLSSDTFTGSRHIGTLHDVDFASALQIVEKLHIPLPVEICIYAIEVMEVNIFSEECTGKVNEAIPVVVEKVLQECIQSNVL